MYVLKGLLIFICCSFTYIGAQEVITDSVVAKIVELENNPPNKYSERHFLDIQKALSHKASKIRVVTYNILFDLFDSSLEDKMQSWKERLPLVIASIKNMDPDILCVQEPYPAQLKDLQNNLSDSFSSFIGSSTTGELNAIFYKKSRFTLNENESASLALPLNPLDDALVLKISDFLPPELEPGRQLTVAHFHDTLTNKDFAVLNTHLTFYRVNSREDQVYFITDLVRKIHEQKKPVIVAGDFNTLPNRTDIERFRFYDGDHLKCIFHSVVKNTSDTALLGHIGPLSTFTKDFLKSDSKPFENRGTPGVVLDHIFVSPEVCALINAAEPSLVNGHFPSDHMPVIADILLP